jgi:hypothetical protein
MTQRHTPAELPLHVTDEEKIELERGRRLLEAMIDVVRRTRLVRDAQSEEVSCND